MGANERDEKATPPPRIGCMLCSELEQDCGRHPDEDSAGEAAILEEEQDLRERLHIDPGALTPDLVRCPGDLAYLGSRVARATLARGRAKIRVKKLRALVYLECKQTAIDIYGQRGATVDVINALVGEDKRILAAEEDELAEEVRLAVAKTNFTAAEARRDMLVQLGSTQRKEMERDPVVTRGRGGYRSTEE